MPQPEIRVRVGDRWIKVNRYIIYPNGDYAVLLPNGTVVWKSKKRVRASKVVPTPMVAVTVPVPVEEDVPGKEDTSPGNDLPGKEDTSPGNDVPGKEDTSPGNDVPGKEDTSPGNDLPGEDVDVDFDLDVF